MATMTDFIFLGSKITADGDCSHEVKRRLILGRKVMTNLDILLKSRDITLLTKVCIVKVMFFPSGHIWMWELDYKEGWAPKNWCFQTLVLEKTLESPLDSKEIKPITPKGNQPWIFIERTAARAEAPILWLPGTESWLIGKDPDAGKDWRQKRRGAAEDEMVEWHHRLNGHGQGRLACCHSWGHKESDVTEQLENNNHTLPPLPCSLLSSCLPPHGHKVATTAKGVTCMFTRRKRGREVQRRAAVPATSIPFIRIVPRKPTAYFHSSVTQVTGQHG